MNWYVGVKFLHIIAAMMLIGGLFGRQLVRARAKKTDDVQIFAALSQAAGRIENLMVIPGSQGVTILGVILALGSGYPILGFLQGAAQNWLFVSTILLVLMFVLVPTVLIPRGKKFGVILEAALAKGEMTPELRAAMDDRAVRLAHLYEEVSLVMIVALMVWKPF
jgi:uncharacterized membrane protein